MSADVSGGLTGEAEGWLRLSPLGIAVQLLRVLGNMIIPLAIVAYSAGSGDGDSLPGQLGAVLGFAGLAVFALFALIFGLTFLAWYRQQYRIGSSDIRMVEGVFGRKTRSVPFERIQDVSLEQKLLPRLLGLVEVRFETGAGGKDELKLSYVSESEGERLRETLRAQAEQQRHGSAQEDEAEATQAEPGRPETARTLFAMGPGRLFTFGLFEFSLVVFAALFGIAQQFEFLLPHALTDFDYWGGVLAGQGAWVMGADLLTAFIGGITALSGLLAVGFLSGVGKTFLRDFDFRLERTSKGFRRRRGLLTRTDVVMPVNRVQAIRLTTGWLRRLWGWHGLSFISLAQDAGSANHDVAPFAQMEEIAPIVGEADFALPGADVEWHLPSANYVTDRAIVLALLGGVVAIAAISFGQVAAGVAITLLAILLIVRQYWLWRHERHALDPRQVLSRRGWLSPRLTVASRVKLHSAEIARGPIARWRGYATLHFGLAGGRLSFRGLPVEQAHKLRQQVLHSIAEVDFAVLPR